MSHWCWKLLNTWNRQPWSRTSPRWREKCCDNGCLLTTMPNEKGIPLLVKALAAKLAGIRRSEYTATQFIDALMGRMDRVPRGIRGRKGFDYSQVAHVLAKYFPFLTLEGVGLLKLPPHLSTNIGIVASKTRSLA